MEPTKSTYEVVRGKQRESVEVSEVENGYIIRHYPHEGPSKEYVALNHKEAHKTAKKCLGKEEDEEEEKWEKVEPLNKKKGKSASYENKY